MFDIFGLERQISRIGLSLINQLANEIGLLAHVISKLKMAETLLSEIMLEELVELWLSICEIPGF